MRSNPIYMVIIVLGLPGSGKSYFAKRVAQMLTAQYISTDELRKEMFSVLAYSTDEKLTVYKEMMRLMHCATDKNKDVVLDGTFYKNNIRQKFIEEGKKNARIFLIEVRADEDIIHERLRVPRAYSDADFDVYKIIKKEWEPVRDNHLVLRSTNNNITQMLEHSADYIFAKA